MIELRVEEGALASILAVLLTTATRYPGDLRLVVLSGGRELWLGPAFSFSGSAACMSLLGEFGAVVLAPAR